MPNIAENIVFPFVGTVADLLPIVGWAVDTDFADKYVLGCSSSDTSGGGTGGYAEHNHTIVDTHVHTATSPNSTGTNNDNAGLGTPAADRHQHSFTLSSLAPTVSDTANNPANVSAMFLRSLGTSSNLYAKFMFWSDNPIFSPSPFTGDFTSCIYKTGLSNAFNSRMFVGTAVGSDAGSAKGSNTHTHIYNHSHISPVTVNTSTPSVVSLSARGAGVSNSTHSHFSSFGIYFIASSNNGKVLIKSLWHIISVLLLGIPL